MVTTTPASFSASIFASAPPLPPAMIAPACPGREEERGGRGEKRGEREGGEGGRRGEGGEGRERIPKEKRRGRVGGEQLGDSYVFKGKLASSFSLMPKILPKMFGHNPVLN